MFSTEQAQRFLLFLFEFEHTLLERHVLFKMQTGFTRKVNGSLGMAERGKLLFGRIQLRLDTRQLFFQEGQRFFRFGTTHLDILFQIRICDSVQNSSNSVGITIFERHPNNARVLAFFRNIETLEQSCSGFLRV